MQHFPRPGSQRGFTLVEIAVVLVIIGLLLGAILKGQELVENSRVKNAANAISSIRAAANGYVDRYRSMPGDDGPVARVQARGSAWTPVTVGGNSNGPNAIELSQRFIQARSDRLRSARSAHIFHPLVEVDRQRAVAQIDRADPCAFRELICRHQRLHEKTRCGD